MEKKDSMSGGRTKQSIGIMMLLVAVFMGAIVMSLGKDEMLTENFIMLIVMFICATLAVFGIRTLAIVVTGLQVVSYFAFKVYSVLVLGNEFNPLSLSWIVIPALAMVGMTIFAGGFEKMKVDNEVLQRQVDELVMIDSLTGLYNLRSLFMDIQTQISYAERNGSAISLMIIKLRYPDEMKAVLKKDQFNQVIKNLGTLLVDTVRLEDKVYSIGPNGKFGIVLTCDKSGTKIVEGRMRGKLDNPEWFSQVADKPIRAEVKIGYMQYDKEKFHRDVNSFMESVEEEVEYDI